MAQMQEMAVMIIWTKRPRDFVKEALNAAVESGIDLSEFDEYDQYDNNGDGNKMNQMV